MSEIVFPVRNYNLATTLSSGQVFRWKFSNGAWEGIVNNRWMRVMQHGEEISATTSDSVSDWNWLQDFLQVNLDLDDVISTFPDDEPMRQSLAACRGLRLLKQNPWECLASFILSSTKQIVQIQQIVAQLCQTFGEPVRVPKNHEPVFSFPSPEKIAACTEAELRACKMGFRAPYLLGSAQKVWSGEINLENIYQLPLESARAELIKFPGVGRKIADCVLLFAYGFPQAFPVDVWVLKALRQLYFPKRSVKIKRLMKFSETHFGPFSGYAQQYLFHYMRTKNRPLAVTEKK